MMDEVQLIEGIRDALSYSAQEVSVLDVIKGLKDNTYQCFEFETGFVITCIVQYDRKKALRLCLAKGLETDIAAVMSVMDSFAQDMCCDFIEVYGRKGWVRQLKQYGYNEQYTVVIKHIGGSNVEVQ